jgi:CHAT domain-containing protein
LTRPLDRHLDGDELDALVTSQAPGVSVSGTLPQEATGEAQRHVESCQDCDRKVQMHRSAQSAISQRAMGGQATKGPNCSVETEWVRVAAGMLETTEAKERMSHAAQCGHCGPLLRAAVRSISDESTPDEEAVITKLLSSRPDWQTEMAQTLRSGTASRRAQEPTQSIWKKIFYLSRPVLAAAVLVIVAVAVWLSVRTLRPPSAEQLLAQAYTERRTIEVRIPNAKYAPIRVERGGAGSHFDKPGSLLKAEYLISENLHNHPNDPAWLEAKARAEMLDGSYDDAIKTLQRVLESQPDSPTLLTDLGSAYYLRAKSADHPIDYGNAIEQFGRALSKNPENPIALFNRALACKEMFLYTQAVDDWQRYLRLDPQGEWSEEARRRLAEIQDKVKRREQSRAEPLSGPSEIATIHNDSLARRVDQRMEEYQDLAVGEWLPRAFSANPQNDPGVSDIKRALRVLSDMAIQRHDDPWLGDLLAGQTAAEFPAAVKDLSEAVRANERADSERAHKYASRAALSFRHGNNVAGMMRAQIENSSALWDGGAGCDRTAKALDPAFRGGRYRWLQARFELEEAVCAWLHEDLGVARNLYAAASEDAQAYDYQALHLRSQDRLAGIEAEIGGLDSAWRRSYLGLATFWSGNYPDVRGYNFYFDLYELTRVAGLAHAQVADWRDGMRLTDSSPDIAQRAMAHLAMGNAAENAGMRELAAAEYARSDELFTQSPQIPSTRSARLEAETRLAGVEASQGKIQQAIARTKPLQPEIDRLSDNSLAILFYTTLGLAESKQAEGNGAQDDLQRVVRLAERQLRGLGDAKSRFEVMRESSGAYRALVQNELLKGNPERALSLWESYKAAPLRRQTEVDLFRYLPLLTNQTVVSYAMLPKGLAIWVMDSRGVFSHWQEGRNAEIVSTAARLRDLCADPSSDPSDLQSNARVMYDALILPIRDHLETSRMLVVEMDEGLDGLAPEVFVDEQGRYLAEVATVISSLGISYRDESRPAEPISSDTPALIVGVPTSGTELGLDLTPLPDVLAEADTVSHSFHAGTVLKADRATRESILERLQDTRIFHFAGHGINTPEQTGVVTSDGLITAASITKKLLSHLQLAVFSACDTAKGTAGTSNDGETLVRAFLQAGVPNVVASRWKVDSTVTRLFMELFYRQLLGGHSVAAAIHTAEVELRSQPGTSHPYYWSAFGAFGTS